METTDATEDSWIMLSNMLNKTESLLNLITNTLPVMDIANPPLKLKKLTPHSLMFQETNLNK